MTTISCRGHTFRLDAKQATFLAHAEERKMPFVFFECPKCKRSVRRELAKRTIPDADRPLMRCPKPRCAGWIANIEDVPLGRARRKWGCGACGSVWDSDASLFADVAITVARLPHRARVYVRAGDRFTGVAFAAEPKDYVPTVEEEPMRPTQELLEPGNVLLAELSKAPGRQALDPSALSRLGFTPKTAAVLEAIGAQRIAGDFIIPATEGLVAYNTSVPFVPPGWLCFAASGTGDLWLLEREPPHGVAFLDHDQESLAKPRRLNLDLGRWVELAFYMRSLDRVWGGLVHDAVKRRSARDTRAFLESLSKGLSKRYPYKLS